MKRFVLPLLAATALGACVENQTPIRILNAVPFDDSCKAASGVYSPSADLEIGYAESSPASLALFQLFQVESNLQAPASGTADPAGNDFVVSEVELNYTSQPSATYQTERLPYFAVIRAGARADQQNIGVNLIGPAAAQTLFSLLPTQTAGTVQLGVSIKLVGKVGGQAEESNTVVFPVTVFHQATASACVSPNFLGREACTGTPTCIASTTTP